MTIFTAGYGGLRSIKPLIDILKKHKIKAVIDVRKKPNQAYLACFTARKLQETLPKAGIQYWSVPELGNLERRLPWVKGTNVISALQETTRVSIKFGHVCLLCSENPGIKNGKPCCHRVEVAEEVKRVRAELVKKPVKIVHLRGKNV